MGVASGSVMLTKRSAVLLRDPELKERSCLPSREIQSSLRALFSLRLSSPAVGSASATDAQGLGGGDVTKSSISWLPVFSKSSLRWFCAMDRERRLSASALALTLVESKYSSSPHTSPASKHSS